MVKVKKYKPTEPLILDYNKLFIIPAKYGDYTAIYGDTEYTFKDTDIDEVCDKINAAGYTSFLLSKEELTALIEKLKECGC